MASPKSNAGSLVIPKLQTKDSISLRHIRSSSKLINLSGASLHQNSTKNMLKSKLMAHPLFETTTHKRTISENTDNGIIRNTSNNIEAIHRRLLSKIENIPNPDEKLSKMVDFLDNLVISKSRYSGIFATISETVKEYQKYVRHLDSTRIDNTERKSVKKKEKIKASKEILKKGYKKADRITLNSSTSCAKIKDKSLSKAPEVLKKRDLSSNDIHNPVEKKKSLSKSKHRSMKTCVNIPLIDIPHALDKGYHQEFMDMYDEFSESWRQEVRKLNNNKN